MLIDRPQVTETSAILNATVASGTSDPANPDIGELFFRTDLNQLRVYTGSTNGWAETGANSLATHAANSSLHLTPAQNALLGGLASTLTSSELNYVDGVTAPIQTQLDAKLNRDGSNAATGNLNAGGFRVTNVGAPTANTDAANMQHVEQQISVSVPVGLRGQVPFVSSDNTRVSTQAFTASTGQFVETDAELTAAQTRIVSNATIFNEWYRFSHGAAIGGTLTRTAGVSQFKFTSANSTTLLASFPVGSNITVLCPGNTTFNGTWVITESGVSGTAYLRWAQVGQADVATAVAGSIVLDTLQPALSAEISSWAYDSVNDVITSTVNSDSHIGFVSDKRYSAYQLEAQLSSTTADDDSIGVLLAWAVSGGREYTLTAIRSPGGNGFTWRIYYNYLRSDSQIVYEGTPFVKWGNGGIGATAGAAGYVANTAGSNWADQPTGCRIRVTRAGDVFTVETTDMNQTTYLTGGAVATIDLTSAAYLNKFRGPTPYGFSAMSQSNASFKTLNFTDNQNAIYDVRNGNKYEYVSGAWALQSGETLLGDFGPGRFLFDRYTEKLYYSDADLGVIKLVTNVGETLAPQVTALQTNLATHIADDARHLTAAQNSFLDGLSTSLTSTEINQLVGVSTAETVQQQLSARLRLSGADTMGGNLQMGGNRVVGVGTPVAATDAATKGYVDTFAQGLTWKKAVKVATAGPITLSGHQTVNGVAVVTNDRVLVKDQATASENGIYDVSSSLWSRSADANTAASLDGAAVFAIGGTVDSDSAWIQINPVATVGSSPLTWTRFGASGAGVTAGVGINVAGTVVSVDAGQGLTFSGNSLVANVNTTDFAFSSGQINLTTLAGLTPATYGSASQIPVVTVNDKGRVTAISAVSPSFQATDATLSAIAAIADGSFGFIARTSDTTAGAVVRSLAVNGSGATVTNANGVNGNPTININDTSVNVPNRVVSRDAAGDFAAGTITATLSGSATNNVLKSGDTMSGALTFSSSAIGVEWSSLTNFYVRADIGAGNPGINFDANDYIDYTRTTNTMTFAAGGAIQLQVSGASISTPAGFQLLSAAPVSAASWLSTPAYGVGQGDNRTHFGYNGAGTFGNYIRGAFTEVSGILSVGSTSNFTGAATFFGNAIISNGTPSLIIRDTDNSGTGIGQTGRISLQDSGATERAWFGFGTPTTTDLGLVSTRGNIYVAATGEGRLQIDTTTVLQWVSGQVNITGNMVASGDVTAFSDRRLKTDIVPIADAVKKVQSISGVTYTRADTGRKGTGVIAQDVQAVLPEAVVDAGGTLSVAYGNMVGLLIEAIKELKAEIEDLKTQIPGK